MSMFGNLRSDRPDEISEKERRMADITKRFDQVIADLPSVIHQAENVVQTLKDIRQEVETVHLLKEVAANVRTQEDADEAQPGTHRA